MNGRLYRVARRLGREESREQVRFRRRYGFAPPPSWSDFSGYEQLLDVIVNHRLQELPGDVLEIGVLMGGGTAKLCGLLERLAPEKRVFAIDIFDPSFDQTMSPIGVSMADLYAMKLGDREASQRMVFDRITSSCRNLIVIAGDSTKVALPAEQLVFSFIDGHHATDYARADFATAWSRTVRAGIVAFHDYGGDLRHLTTAIHQLIGEHAAEIDRVWSSGIMLFVKKV